MDGSPPAAIGLGAYVASWAGEGSACLISREPSRAARTAAMKLPGSSMPAEAPGPIEVP